MGVWQHLQQSSVSSFTTRRCTVFLKRQCLLLNVQLPTLLMRILVVLLKNLDVGKHHGLIRRDATQQTTIAAVYYHWMRGVQHPVLKLMSQPPVLPLSATVVSGSIAQYLQSSFILSSSLLLLFFLFSILFLLFLSFLCHFLLSFLYFAHVIHRLLVSTENSLELSSFIQEHLWFILICFMYEYLCNVASHEEHNMMSDDYHTTQGCMYLQSLVCLLFHLTVQNASMCCSTFFKIWYMHHLINVDAHNRLFFWQWKITNTDIVRHFTSLQSTSPEIHFNVLHLSASSWSLHKRFLHLNFLCPFSPFTALCPAQCTSLITLS